MLRKEQIEYALHYAEDPVEWVFELVRRLEKRIDELSKFGTKVTVFQEHWHPASELPVILKDEDSVWVYCLVYGEGTDGTVLAPMCVEFTKLGWRLNENIIVKWWCYPPEKED